MNVTLEQLVDLARAGNGEASEEIVRQIQDQVYGLALRTLWHPADAADATQEILIRVITHLGSFRGDSKFTTWVYKVAANYLRDVRRSRLEDQRYTFKRFGQELDEGLSDALIQSEGPIEEALLLEEIKLGCTLGMLLCLDRSHRLAYILGEILEVESSEGAAILEITPGAFRQKLSRARASIVEFMKRKCGLANPSNRCRCRSRVNHALKLGRINPKQLLFARDAEEAMRFPEALSEIRKLEEARRSAALYRAQPKFTVPATFVTFMRELISSVKFH